MTYRDSKRTPRAKRRTLQRRAERKLKQGAICTAEVTGVLYSDVTFASLRTARSSGWVQP